MTTSAAAAAADPSSSSADSSLGWERQGLFRFTFTVQTADKSVVLGTKEAHDHAFSHKTSNWGWAQFIKRDTVYYNNSLVKASDAFLITVSIQASPSRPSPAKPPGITVPPVLVEAYGSLLDDPEHSDVVFHIARRGGVAKGKSSSTRRIYAIRKILAARSEYFCDMFEGGFIEGEEQRSDDDDDGEGDEGEEGRGGEVDRADIDGREAATSTSASSSRKTPRRRRATTTVPDSFVDEALLHDSDAEIDMYEGADGEDDAEGDDGDEATTAAAMVARSTMSTPPPAAPMPPSKASTPAPLSRRGQRRHRRKVVVRDSSYATFKALLYFLYTDTIEFAPLTSSFISGGGGQRKTGAAAAEGAAAAPPQRFNAMMLRAHTRRQEVIAEYCRRWPSRPAPCSAKAMYRLADKLQISDLKRRAQEHLCASLTVHNIVWEAFSSFTSHFPDVRKMEIDFLLKHWQAVKRTQAMKTIFTRSHAHPGLAEVWPHLLSQLDYRNGSSSGGGNDERGESVVSSGRRPVGGGGASRPSRSARLGGGGGGGNASGGMAAVAGDEEDDGEGDDDDDDDDDEDDEDDEDDDVSLQDDDEVEDGEEEGGHAMVGGGGGSGGGTGGAAGGAALMFTAGN